MLYIIKFLSVILPMQKKWYSSDFNVGILGGGQLGRMLIQEAVNFNVNIHCLDPDPNAPCCKIANSFTVGSLNDFETVFQFGKEKDVVSVEIENVNCEALEKLESEGIKVFPQPRVLKLIKDKGLQKQFYLENNIPTSPFKLIENKEDLHKHSDYLPFVQKLRTGGYDGKGVFAIKNDNQLKDGFDAPSVLEKFVDFEKELAIIVARNENKEIVAYPVVECEFNSEANLVEFLFSPAEITNEIEENAKKIAAEIISKLDMIGLLAVEFFLTKNGELLVNEIAPRPHNSGHHTIECNTTSQYEQHLRSIVNLPLGGTDLIQPGVMINLLGEANFEGEVYYENIEKVINIKGVHPHLYGKTHTKPFRKMGHITIVNKDLEKAKEIAKKVQKEIKVKSC